MEDLKQMCEGYERVLKKRMENLPDYNLKELRRVVTDKGAPMIPTTVQTGVKKIETAKIGTTIKTSKASQKVEEGRLN